jgi:hypothetical protein
MGNFKAGRVNKNKKPGQVLSILPSGGGVSTIPQVICLANAFPSEIQVGNWFCFHGDGTSHGVVSGTPTASGVFTAVGSPATQTLHTTPDGPNCGLVSGQLVSSGNNFVEANLSPALAGSFSVGVLASRPDDATGTCYVGKFGAAHGPFLLQGASTIPTFYTDDGATTSIAGPTTVTGACAASNLIVGTLAYVGAGAVNTGVCYFNGVAGSTSTSMRPATATSVLTRIGAYNNATTNPLVGSVKAAFLTEKTLSAATVQAMSDYATGKTSGSYGETITYTRNTIATAVTPDGTVVKLPANRPAIVNGGLVIEPTATNKALQSEALATTWTAYGSLAPTVTNNSTDLLAPDGTQTATKMVWASGNDGVNAGGQRYNPTLTVASYTASVWLRVASGTATNYIYLFDQVTAVGTRTTCNLTSTWQRFSVTYTATSAATPTVMLIGHTTQAGVGGDVAFSPQTAYAWGAQTELGSTATSYIPTTTGTVTRNAVTATVSSTARTNSLLRSQQMSSVWTMGVGGALAVSTDATSETLAPDGTQTAIKLALAATLNAGDRTIAYQSITTTAVSWTQSVWLRATAPCTVSLMRFNTGGATLGTATELSVTTSWARYSLTSTAQAGTNYYVLGNDRSLNNQGARAAATLYVWGAQWELGSTATDYIPTTTTPRTVLANGVNDVSGGLSGQVYLNAYTGAANRIISFTGTSSPGIYFKSATVMTAYDGTNTVDGPTVASMVGRWVPFKMEWWGTSMRVQADGVWGSTGAYDGTLVGSPIYIGSSNTGVSEPVILKDVVFRSSRF